MDKVPEQSLAFSVLLGALINKLELTSDDIRNPNIFQEPVPVTTTEEPREKTEVPEKNEKYVLQRVRGLYQNLVNIILRGAIRRDRNHCNHEMADKLEPLIELPSFLIQDKINLLWGCKIRFDEETYQLTKAYINEDLRFNLLDLAYHFRL